MKSRCLLWSLFAAELHGILATQSALYSGIFCGLPAAFIEELRGVITGNEAKAEYFIGRMADLFPYILGGECLLIIAAGVLMCRRHARKKLAT